MKRKKKRSPAEFMGQEAVYSTFQIPSFGRCSTRCALSLRPSTSISVQIIGFEIPLNLARHSFRAEIVVNLAGVIDRVCKDSEDHILPING